MLFYLGSFEPFWMYHATVPLFISARRLRRQKTWKQSRVPWALDSGGFTEVSTYGRWMTSPATYVEETRRWRDTIGNMQWAAPQDAMCEPWVLEKAADWLGGTVIAHQRWTVNNLLELRNLAPDVPYIPVLQGWKLDDYLNHIDQYGEAGIDLRTEPLVGLGSVCRRQATSEIVELVTALYEHGLRLHGFGVKTSGIGQYGHLLTSADSMAWNVRGYHIRPCPHTGKKSCAGCYQHALDWRTNVLNKLGHEKNENSQLRLFHNTPP